MIMKFAPFSWIEKGDWRSYPNHFGGIGTAQTIAWRALRIFWTDRLNCSPRLARFEKSSSRTASENADDHQDDG